MITGPVIALLRAFAEGLPGHPDELPALALSDRRDPRRPVGERSCGQRRRVEPARLVTHDRRTRAGRRRGGQAGPSERMIRPVANYRGYRA
ncbi:hypothetical protein IOD16_17255 [Saccharothrix sp. 6-C]|uniref:hypothetical protein n=1 Tax=Saccharothrix sp. 6-C TaxID=2781735 RepID=UPI0019175F55|nr:hypothetical protein [Saccharothrix sp. 6-C]QQQ79980.1 hypothetical protein IOD16_17255 [Saccharothrix sp. 6-C]